MTYITNVRPGVVSYGDQASVERVALPVKAQVYAIDDHILAAAIKESNLIQFEQVEA